MKLFHTLLVLLHCCLAGVTVNHGETTPPPAKYGVVTVYSSRACRPCYRMQHDVRGKTDWDWQFRYGAHPSWVHSTPFIVWRGANGRRYYVDEWVDFETWQKRWERTQ